MDRESKQDRKRHREELIAQRMKEDAARQQPKPGGRTENQRPGQDVNRGSQPSGKPRLPD